MSSLLKINPFKGLADGSEDPEGFLDDVQAAAEGWHMAHPTDSESSNVLQTTMIRFFRQNLLGGYDAACWWRIALPAATKKSCHLVKKAFREKFGQAGYTKEGDFATTTARLEEIPDRQAYPHNPPRPSSPSTILLLNTLQKRAASLKA